MSFTIIEIDNYIIRSDNIIIKIERFETYEEYNYDDWNKRLEERYKELEEIRNKLVNTLIRGRFVKIS